MGTVPGGSLSNASLTGANTVNGPAPDSASTRPAAFTAATSVVWSLELTAFSMMFLLSYIAAPPTILGAAKVGNVVAPNARMDTASSVRKVLCMIISQGRPLATPRDGVTGDVQNKFWWRALFVVGWLHRKIPMEKSAQRLKPRPFLP